MKTIGLIGGMSWESSELYYRWINQGVKAKLGGLHSAKLVLYSLDFQEIEALQHRGAWDETAEILARAAQSLEAAGADCVLICTNTMHKVAAQVSRAITIPLLRLADATAKRVKAQGIRKVGLLGTAFTMEQDFYKERLIKQGIEVLIPNAEDRKEIHRIIYEELCLGIVRDESRRIYLDIMDKLAEAGAEATIEGCTKIVLLVRQGHTGILIFNTTAIHAEEAVAWALE